MANEKEYQTMDEVAEALNRGELEVENVTYEDVDVPETDELSEEELTEVAGGIAPAIVAALIAAGVTLIGGIIKVVWKLRTKEVCVTVKNKKGETKTCTVKLK